MDLPENAVVTETTVFKLREGHWFAAISFELLDDPSPTIDSMFRRDFRTKEAADTWIEKKLLKYGGPMDGIIKVSLY